MPVELSLAGGTDERPRADRALGAMEAVLRRRVGLRDRSDNCADRTIEQRIAEAPAEGLVGIAIKLTLWRLTNSHKDAAAVQAEAAYCDVIGLVGRDFSAEAEVIAERLSSAMSPAQ